MNATQRLARAALTLSLVAALAACERPEDYGPRPVGRSQEHARITVSQAQLDIDNAGTVPPASPVGSGGRFASEPVDPVDDDTPLDADDGATDDTPALSPPSTTPEPSAAPERPPSSTSPPPAPVVPSSTPRRVPPSTSPSLPSSTPPAAPAGDLVDILAGLGFDFAGRLPGWTIERGSLPARFYGVTEWSGGRTPGRIVIDHKPGAPVSEVHVIAHEVGHALDITCNSDDDRDVWLYHRGRSGTRWGPTRNNQADWALPSGDFAEAIAQHLTGEPSLSEWGPPSPYQVELAAALVSPVGCAD